MTERVIPGRRTTADVVVIGGGIIGSSCAYFLAREGLDVVQVEEAAELAAGASGACDGFIILQDKAPGPELDLGLLSAQLYAELSRRLDLDFEYNPKGGLQLAENDLEMALLRQRVAGQVQGGLEVRLIGRDEVLTMEPALAPDVRGASFCPLEAEVNPILTTLAFVHGARKMGARQLLGASVTAIRVAHGCLEGVIAGGGEITAPRVVVAGGAWSPMIGVMAGIKIPVLPRRGQVLVTEPVGPMVGRILCESGYLSTKLETGTEPETGTNSGAFDFNARERSELGISFILEQTRAGNLLIGSSRDFAGYDRRTTHRTMMALARRAARFVPGLKNIRLIRSYAGLRPYSPDHRPIIGRTERLRGFFLATGHEGDGITLAPATGHLLAQLIAGRNPEISLDDYSPDRPGLDLKTVPLEI